jgi:hypothetical protein
MATYRYEHDWPLILCGPILRRVEATSVSIFIALKAKRHVRLTIYRGDLKSQGNFVKSADAQTVQLGLFLHVSLVTVELDTGEALEPSQLYGYNLEFIRPADVIDTFHENVDLEELGELNSDIDHIPLGYENGKLPTFCLPPSELSKVRLLQAGCLLPHGDGRNSLVTVDQLIKDDLDPEKRPHQMFFTGDQIYVDDVAPSILTLARVMGEHLLSSTEVLPGNNGNGIDTKNIVFAPGRRSRIIYNRAKFTGSHSTCHLVSLAELYCSYLLHWSDAIWPRSDGKVDLPSFDQVIEDYPGLSDDSLESLQGFYNQTHWQSVSFGRGLKEVRRALANIPNYMIFDDHEVTDDWNIHRKWVEDVKASPLGTRIVHNALSAYAVFQAWGNDPDQFRQGKPGKALLDKLEQWQGKQEPPSEIAEVLGLSSSSGERIRWSYEWGRTIHSAYIPPYQVIVLDTRTQREFPNSAKSTGREACGLLSESALADQLGDSVSLHNTGPTIIVSAAPVFGYPFIEEFAQPVGIAVWNAFPSCCAPGELEYDNEAWSFNSVAFERFLHTILKLKQVIVLSGDVHYSFGAEVDYWGQLASDEAEQISVKIVQLTCSPLKNNQIGLLAPRGLLGLTPKAESLGFLRTAQYFGWNQRGPWIRGCHTFDSSANTFSRNVGGLGKVYRQDDDFAVMSVDEDHPPDWCYRINFLRDQREESERYRDPPPWIKDELEKLATPHGINEKFAREARRRQVWENLRVLVGFSNVGDIRFSENADEVIQIFHCDPDVKDIESEQDISIKLNPGPFTELKASIRQPQINNKPSILTTPD